MRATRNLSSALLVAGWLAGLASAAAGLEGGPSAATLSLPGRRTPYPPSEILKEVAFDFSSHDRRAPGSDNWPITWADDDHQYTAWGDGGGFGGTDSEGRVSLGIARVEGDRANHSGYNVWGGKNPEHPAQFAGKSYGILAIGGVLYLWVSPGSDATGYREARLCRSTNHGATWTQADWAFTHSDAIIFPAFCQFGKDYAGARDKCVYIYATRVQDASGLKVQSPGQVELLRVPADKLMDRSAYRLFAGLGANGNPGWTKHLSDRRPVFEDAGGVGWCLSVTYNAGLKRYLLCTEHGESFQGNLGIFDAPEPWGPWTTVCYDTHWGGLGPTFFWNFSSKWFSADGRNFTMVFTGTDRNDAWNTVKGAFSLHGTRRDGAGPDAATGHGGAWPETSASASGTPTRRFGVHPRFPRHFVYRGQPCFFVGKSAFALIDADWKAFIDEAHRDRFTALRIWLCCPALTKKHGNDRFY